MVWLQGHVGDWNQGRYCSIRFLNFSAAILITESLQGWVLERGFRRSAMGLQTGHPRPLQHPLDHSGPARLRTILDCFGMAWHWFLGSGRWDFLRSSSLVWWSHQVMTIFGAIGCLLLQDVNWKLWLDHPSMFGDRIKCRSFWVDFKGRFMN